MERFCGERLENNIMLESGAERTMVKISIIIPVFNNEEYLEQCIESVQRQTVKELEIICVDDGSKDQSAELIRRLRQEDARIILHQQENRGAAAARNVGIQLAGGEYIAFLDADDYYRQEDALRQMIDCCEKNQVKACGSVMYLLQEEEKPAPSVKLVKKMAEEGILAYRNYQLDYDFTTFIFKREMILEDHIRFPEYRYFEDPPFLTRALDKAEYFCMLDLGLYCYRKMDVAFKLTREKTKDLLRGLLDNLNYAKERQLADLFGKTLDRLEYEYGTYIYHNVTLEDTEEIELLTEAGNIAAEQLQCEKYVVRPLRMILDGAYAGGGAYEDALRKKVQEADSVAVYGAGKFGKRFLDYLKKYQLDKKVSCVIVSKKSNEETMFAGIPILELKDYRKKTGEVIFVAMGGMNYKAVKKELDQRKILDYEPVDEVFLETGR